MALRFLLSTPWILQTIQQANANRLIWWKCQKLVHMYFTESATLPLKVYWKFSKYCGKSLQNSIATWVWHVSLEHFWEKSTHQQINCQLSLLLDVHIANQMNIWSFHTPNPRNHRKIGYLYFDTYLCKKWACNKKRDINH